MICGAFFLFVTADAFSNAFLPVHARNLPLAWPGLSPEMASGLPVSAFWLMVAAAQLTTGLWERGRPHRTLILAAMVLSGTGLALTGLAGTVHELILWRGVSGFGYGIVMILAQDGILRTMGPEARTQASGKYLSAFFAGTICGTLTGSAVAAAAGFGNAFFAAAAVTACALILTLFLDNHRETAPRQPFRPLVLLRNPLLVALVAFAAVPSRLLIAAFLYYLLPLYLHDAEASPTETARIVMIYSLILALTATAWSRLVDRTGRPMLFTSAGIVLSAASMMVIPVWGPGGDGAALSGMAAAVAAVALLGTAQSIGMSPQVTVLFRVARAEIDRFGRTPVLGIYRVCERVGLFVGPMAAAWLVGGYGYGPALAALGVLAALSAAALLAAFALAPTPLPEGPAARPDEASEQETTV
ncbi:MFS transporter [Skermanella rosea]|uniref:MFS transporter n=1 Tax=Skermanella rosea TaxID=1817965 RepID=UPI00193438F1|nr:MFS transporter [Skermanella rosea]UEM03077.1 MFS transporter [Skermanella rosea]